ncbi:ATP phosphoribosyltransferase [Egibacter rhizosphaerae]|uniref:ATP phosphoribosyltransferase n=1 Tax=Egibacter rhizosphaerae TaxID=1670831 RepID=A0A411YDA7_9ACTN|nr:ATP phosphoribosyltransferase [Egibacter rhizosphaerae]QBI19201.1 ATP phosphoribosyltransferase [Egibacter rhizosphaerae]
MTTTPTRIALPSKGRLRDDVLAVLETAGYGTGAIKGGGAMAGDGELEFLEMRPRDAGAALAAGQLAGAFISTDIAMEHGLEDLPTRPLGFSRSDLVVASRDDDGRYDAGDLDGAVIATHLPNVTRTFFAGKGLDVTIVEMGGSLEGFCAAGLADAIVDLRETGRSLRANRLRVLEQIRPCEAVFTRRHEAAQLADLELRMEAVLSARQHRYVMLHVREERLDALRELFPGLESPTVLPLAARTDLVAVHFVVGADELWRRLSDLRQLGATGIVALEPQALLD